MYEFEREEKDAENSASHDYQRNYHGYPIMEYWDEAFAELVQDYYAPGSRILDLGCGPASLWAHWLKLPEVGELVGLDLSDGMIREARNNYSDGKFLVGRLHALPFPPGSFDIVIASSVLHHIPDSHLDGALEEIVRVMDEHGVLIGREPVGQGYLGSQPGWLSGALMSFRHLLYRLSHAREYPEPELGDHHHAYSVETFFKRVENFLHLEEGSTRFPVSSYFPRIKDSWAGDLGKMLDSTAKKYSGTMIYYKADKNFAQASDVRSCIKKLLAENGSAETDKEFLAHLQVAAVEIEKMLVDAKRRDP